MKKILLIAAVFALTLSGGAQTPLEQLPVTEVNGRSYRYYEVQPHETLYSLSQRLGVSREEIIENNPSVADGLQAYTRLYFPVSGDTPASTPGVVAGDTHTIKKGETLYGISKHYGVSIDRLLELNPSAREGVKAGQTLLLAANEEASPAPTQYSGATQPYTIGAGQTLYRIAAEHGLSVEQLLAANPGLDALNYSEGTVIQIPAAAPSGAAASRPAESGRPDWVENIGTMPVTPAVERVGDIESDQGAATQSQPAAETPVRTTAPLPRVQQPGTMTPREPRVPREPSYLQPVPVEAERAGDITESESESAPAPQQKESYTIAVMLPFMLEEATTPRSATMFTDFYKGFLLAADSLSNNGGTPVHIRTYDTCNSLDTVRDLMAKPEMADVDVFVGPDNDAQLQAIIDAADSDAQFVVNVFAVRNEAHVDNPHVIQTNIPHTQMYTRAIDAFVANRGDRTPVFLQRIGGDADKESFVQALKERLDVLEVPFVEITFSGVLGESDWENKLSTSSSYVFIPVSGQRTEFSKFAPGLKRFKSQQTAGADLAMFGYPEWLTFRGDMLDNLATLNAAVYSRFFNNTSYSPNRDVAAKFRRAYGVEMPDVVPSQGMLGYDTATFIITSLRKNGGDFHLSHPVVEGLQTSYRLEDADVEGLVNCSLLLIKFKADGATERIDI